MSLNAPSARAAPADAPATPAEPHAAPADPFYYLANFISLLATLAMRDGDLLAPDELAFMREFEALPRESQALLVRMLMRKGPLFRASRLRYAELGEPNAAIAPLLRLRWVDAAPSLGLADLFRLFTLGELVRALALPDACLKERKSALFARLVERLPSSQPPGAWGSLADPVYRLEIGPLCLRLRLMFFGNYRQDLTEFVLADLGVFNYERITVLPESRPFRSRPQVDNFLALYACRELLANGAPAAEVQRALPPAVTDCDWLDERREKLRFQIGRAHERAGALGDAQAIYATCAHPEAAPRARRLAAKLAGAPRPRLQHRAIPVFEMLLSPRPDQSVEQLALAELGRTSGEETEVRFVENTLITALFGLLCWPAIFAPVPGAFFHAFHRGPADLGSPHFRRRREAEFAACFAHLARNTHREVILARHAGSHGVQSPFVAWGALDESLLRLALDCFPAAHLSRWFEWILADVRANRAGFPDLVQFFPRIRAYRLIEVKAPGDRLQGNQRACIDFMLAQGMPVSVCRVRWRASPPPVLAPIPAPRSGAGG